MGLNIYIKPLLVSKDEDCEFEDEANFDHIIGSVLRYSLSKRNWLFSEIFDDKVISQSFLIQTIKDLSLSLKPKDGCTRENSEFIEVIVFCGYLLNQKHSLPCRVEYSC